MPRKRKATNTQTSTDAPRNYEKPVMVTPHVLPINQRFAHHYEQSKRHQFLSNAPAAIFENSNDSSSSSEEEDEFGELLTKAIDRRVNETLEAIRKKDPRIYDNNTKFFEDANEQSENNNSTSDVEDNSEDEPVAGWDVIANSAEQATSKLTLKDYVRESLLNNGKLSDDDDKLSDLEQEEEHPERHHDTDHHAQRAYSDTLETFHPGRDEGKVEGGKMVSKNAPDNLIDDDDHGEGDNEGPDDDGSDGDDFFTKKEKTAAELEEESRNFDIFMKKRSATTSKQAGEDLLLHSYLEKETPDEKERFLRDFVLNNGWLDKNAGEAPAAHDYEIEIDTNEVDEGAQDPEEEDDFDEKVDKFEAQYNFRFEDPEGAQIVSHARHIPDSMRRPDTRRKRAREARRLKKEQEKAEKAEEIKRLKNLKKKEIQARLLAIQEAAGDGVDLTGIDLEGDFDPETFNKQMESKFNEEYYSMRDEQMNDIGKEGIPHANDKQTLGKGREDLPDDIREDVNRMTDEYYNLDYEDIVGGVPMRFAYKKVEPESFNMTAADILNADDKELNRLVSLKYLAPYRSKRDVQKQAWKVRAALQKRKKDKSGHRGGDGIKNESALHETPSVSLNGDVSASDSWQRKRRKSKSNTDNRHRQNEEEATKAGERTNVKEGDNDRSLARSSARTENDTTEVQDEDVSRERKSRKRRRNRKSRELSEQVQMSESRLKAYGITPSQ